MLLEGFGEEFWNGWERWLGVGELGGWMGEGAAELRRGRRIVRSLFFIFWFYFLFLGCGWGGSGV